MSSVADTKEAPSLNSFKLTLNDDPPPPLDELLADKSSQQKFLFNMAQLQQIPVPIATSGMFLHL